MVLIIEDNAIHKGEALIFLAKNQNPGEIEIFLCKTYEDAKNKIYSPIDWDIVYLDGNLNPGNGVDLIQAIKDCSPEAKIIMTSDSPDTNDKGIKAGAHEALDAEELQKAHERYLEARYPRRG